MSKMEKEGKKKEVTIWNAKNFDEFLGVLGEKVDLNAFTEMKKKLTVSTMYGEVDLNTYDALVATKLFQYFQYGIAYRVGKMIKKQDSNADGNDIKIVLLEMARLEVEYGLRPITHILPVGGSTYIKADGYLFYGKRSGKIKSMRYEEHEEKGAWTTKCIVETTDGTFDGVTTERANNNRMSDPREKARTKSMRRALRKAFPIGAGDEPLIDVEESIVARPSEQVQPPIKIDKPISDLSELVKKPKEVAKREEKSKAKIVDTSSVKELYRRINEREDKSKLIADIKAQYNIKSLALLTEEQAQEVLSAL